MKNYKDLKGKGKTDEKIKEQIKRKLISKRSKIPKFIEREINNKTVQDIIEKSSFTDFKNNLKEYSGTSKATNKVDNNDFGENDENEAEFNDDDVERIIDKFNTNIENILVNTLTKIKTFIHLIPYEEYEKIKS